MSVADQSRVFAFEKLVPLLEQVTRRFANINRLKQEFRANETPVWYITKHDGGGRYPYVRSVQVSIFAYGTESILCMIPSLDRRQNNALCGIGPPCVHGNIQKVDLGRLMKKEDGEIEGKLCEMLDKAWRSALAFKKEKMIVL